MRQRRSSAYRMPSHDIAERFQGRFYNIFPEIADPNGAWYLPIMDGIYSKETISYFEVKYWHELMHAVLSRTLHGCEQRALAFAILAGTFDVVLTSESFDSGWRVMIPSFTIKNIMTGEIDNSLERMADEYDKLCASGEIIQETIACTFQGAISGLDETNIKTIIINHISGERNADFLAELDHILDKFFDVYNKFGLCILTLIGHYSLNDHSLNEDKVLARLRDILKVLEDYPTEYPFIPAEFYKTLPGDLSENMLNDIIQKIISLFDYLSNNLNGFNDWACPLHGACLSKQIEDSFNSDESIEEGLPLYVAILNLGVQVMHKTYCGQRSKMFEDVMTKYIDNKDINELNEIFKPLMLLNMFNRSDDSCIGFAHEYTEEQLSDEQRAFVTGFLPMFEALRQQLFLGEGPLCICAGGSTPLDEDTREACGFRYLLDSIWNFTEPDFEWDANRWKQMKLPCF